MYFLGWEGVSASLAPLSQPYFPVVIQQTPDIYQTERDSLVQYWKFSSKVIAVWLALCVVICSSAFRFIEYRNYSILYD